MYLLLTIGYMNNQYLDDDDMAIGKALYELLKIFKEIDLESSKI